ncbi:probable beta-1,3-galactosyltransferase 12 isoform X2 [Dioscorea cayenensis subsp. rotundata]|uniref:Probable beta-1,3-galactosyltransferase 12 isoform X2 n=1 Tax=Dioscorea cayennensis subsp. rotundata TaxID=55577 RepID=A0AB40BNB6_DIOCR|nr:probable beta-1,3-galactosyltransferase 12 isoform X2 [Dioscorea cayenensis subsp. rotundata]
MKSQQISSIDFAVWWKIQVKLASLLLLATLQSIPRSIPTAVLPPLRISLSLLISGVFFFVGAIGIVFAIIVLLHPPRTVQVSVFQCGRAEDTLRNFRSRSSVGGGAGLEDRPKLLGFVGVQTGIGSADRRAALRSTWFPSDPEALTRTKADPVILAEYVVALLRNDKPKKELQKLCADSLVEFLGPSMFILASCIIGFLGCPRKSSRCTWKRGISPLATVRLLPSISYQFLEI